MWTPADTEARQQRTDSGVALTLFHLLPDGVKGVITGVLLELWYEGIIGGRLGATGLPAKDLKALQHLVYRVLGHGGADRPSQAVHNDQQHFLHLLTD